MQTTHVFPHFPTPLARLPLPVDVPSNRRLRIGIGTPLCKIVAFITLCSVTPNPSAHRLTLGGIKKLLVLDATHETSPFLSNQPAVVMPYRSWFWVISNRFCLRHTFTGTAESDKQLKKDALP